MTSLKNAVRDYNRKILDGAYILNDTHSMKQQSLELCSPDQAHSYVRALRGAEVKDVTYLGQRSNHKTTGAPLVRGRNQADGARERVIVLLKTLKPAIALANGLEKGIVYAELKTSYRGHYPMRTAITSLILPKLQESGEPVEEALGNGHLVSEHHIADVAIGIQTAMAKTGHGRDSDGGLRKPLVRKPTKEALAAVENLQCDNFESRSEKRKDVMEYAAELHVELPIQRAATPKSKKDEALERQRCPDDPGQVFCGHDSLLATPLPSMRPCNEYAPADMGYFRPR
jgi:hypothetical protein